MASRPLYRDQTGLQVSSAGSLHAAGSLRDDATTRSTATGTTSHWSVNLILAAAHPYGGTAIVADLLNVDNQLDLLQELTRAFGPCGQEDEVRAIGQRELGAWCERVWVDATENLVGFVPGRSSDDRRAVHVMAHMDELSMIVKRIEPDGAMRVTPMGGMWPYNFGQGAVEVLGDARTVPGVLSAGSMHTTEESHVQSRSKGKG